jgi:hypothetical protein
MVVQTYNPALRRLRQENHKFKASMGCIVRPCLKTKTKTKKAIFRAGEVAHGCNPSYSGGIDKRIEAHGSLPPPKKPHHIQKIAKAKRAGGMAHSSG